MSRKGSTIDEKILVVIYEMAVIRGDWDNEIEIKEVIRALSFKETAIRTAIKLLMQANFLKKTGETSLRLTKNGLDLVYSLMG